MITITAGDFTFKKNFPNLSDEEIQQALDYSAVMFWGVNDLWQDEPIEISDAKKKQAFLLLGAWYLANINPSAVSGIGTTGGMPLSSKTIGGVSVSFADNANVPAGLKYLTTNAFGNMALQLILGAVEFKKLYGRSFSPRWGG